MSREATIEELFRRLANGDEEAGRELFSLVYGELYSLARGQMANQQASHTLQATALVNEAYLKMCRSSAGEWVDYAHFVHLAASVMRQVLVDHARRKNADKRHLPGKRIELESLVEDYERGCGDLVELDGALERLAEYDQMLVRLVELRFFGGRTIEEVAELMELSPRSAARRWQAARLFLKGLLSQ